MNSNTSTFTEQQFDTRDTFDSKELQSQAFKWIRHINFMLESVCMEITIADESIFSLLSREEKSQIWTFETNRPDIKTSPAVFTVIANCLLNLIAKSRFAEDRKSAEVATGVAIPVSSVDEIDKLLGYITSNFGNNQ